MVVGERILSGFGGGEDRLMVGMRGISKGKVEDS